MSRHSGEEKSAINAKFFVEGQLLDLDEDENDNEGNADDMELEAIDVSIRYKRKGLWLVQEEHGLEVQQQHPDSQVAGHW